METTMMIIFANLVRDVWLLLLCLRKGREWIAMVRWDKLLSAPRRMSRRFVLLEEIYRYFVSRV